MVTIAMSARKSRAGKQRFQGFGEDGTQVWSVDEINLILASARTMPGDVASIPARLWWPALLLTILDTEASPDDLLIARRESFDPESGTLTAGPFIYRLRPSTVEAIERVCRHGHDRVFPWPLDRCRPPFHMLYRHLRLLLYRADLPTANTCLFERLRATARRRDCFNEIRFITFDPRPGNPAFPRAKPKPKPQPVFPRIADVADIAESTAVPTGSHFLKIARILLAASEKTGYVCCIPAAVWWIAFRLTLNATEVDPSALLNAPATALHLATGKLQIGKSEFVLHRDNLDWLRALRPGTHDTLFPFPWGSGAIQERVA